MNSGQNKFRIIIFIAAIIFCNSCLRRYFTEGSAELISISDMALNDSSLFDGYVHRVDFANYPYDAGPYEIWLENTNLKCIADSTGYYSIKTVPGVYTIKSQSVSNTYDILVVEMGNVEIKKNQNIRINFHIGYAVE